MRTTTARPTPARARRTPAVAAVVACLALPLLAGPAHGLPEDLPPGTPTRAEVEHAEQEAGAAARSVADVEAELAAANAAMEAAAVAAAQAAEAANGARWRLEVATEALKEARRSARRAEAQVRGQRDELAGLVSAGYESAGQVSALDAAFGGDGPEGVMGRLLTYEGATASVEAHMQQLAATSALAKTFRDRAAGVAVRRAELAQRAQEAQLQAAAAARAAQESAVAAAERKSELLAELARLQGISVQLAEARQAGIEEAERQAAAEAAALAAEEAAAAEASRAESAVRRRDPTDPADPADTGGSTDRGPDTGSDRTPAPRPAPAPAPAPAPLPAPPPTASGAQRAVAFARAQIGEPYRWAAAGPDAWDCSGLTMAAWSAGGRSLPHYSVAQYTQSTPISPSQLRAGDLVFWGSSSSPSSIHHVALYVGDGMIVHAPRTGRDVTLESMYYWVPPNFFARV